MGCNKSKSSFDTRELKSTLEAKNGKARKGIERQKTLENLNNMLSKRYLHQEEDTAARNLRINETERVPKQSQLLQKSIGAKLVVQRTKQENY